MALKLLKQLSSGVTVEYFRIGEVTVKFTDVANIAATVYGYIDKASRDTGKTPVTTNILGFDLELLDGIDITRSTVYSLIKSHALFEGAVDEL